MKPDSADPLHVYVQHAAQVALEVGKPITTEIMRLARSTLSPKVILDLQISNTIPEADPNSQCAIDVSQCLDLLGALAQPWPNNVVQATLPENLQWHPATQEALVTLQPHPNCEPLEAIFYTDGSGLVPQPVHGQLHSS